MTGLKAIETTYKGYRFRSRLEARWAVYFDAVGLLYEYEPEGFTLENGELYLPDFWLPQVQSWAEVKPEPLNAAEMRRCALLVKGTGHQCLLLVGTPEEKPYDRLEFLHGDSDHSEGRFNLPEGLGLCDAKIDGEYISEQRFYVCTGGEVRDADVRRAVAAARSARFEHGESGPPR